MYISEIRISGYRGVRNIVLPLNKDITVVIGENNVGKSTILDAFEKCLTAVRSDRGSAFQKADFHLTRQGRVNEISLGVTIALSDENEDDEEYYQRFVDFIVGKEIDEIRIQVRASLSEDGHDVVQSIAFLDSDGHEIPQVNFKKIRDVQNALPFCCLRALRDAETAFQGKSTFWSALLNGQNFDEQQRKDLSERLLKLHAEVIDNASGFKDIVNEIGRMTGVMRQGALGTASVRPVEQDLVQVLRYGAEINVTTDDGSPVSLKAHGDGTKNLAVLMLFVAYLKACVLGGQSKCVPLVAIEEPEAHLHPSGVKATWDVLRGMPGQKIIVTHSGDLIARAPVEAIRKVVKLGGEINCCRADYAFARNPVLLEAYGYFVSRYRGSILFARTWFLVEGETDVIAVEACARTLGIDFDALGVSVVEFTGYNIENLLAIADAFGLNWILMCDADQAGEDDLQACMRHVQRSNATGHYYFNRLDYHTLEVSMCMAGYGDYYINALTGDQKSIGLKSASRKDWNIDFWCRVYNALPNKRKVSTMLRVTKDIEKSGSAVFPEDLMGIVCIAEKIGRRDGL